MTLTQSPPLRRESLLLAGALLVAVLVAGLRLQGRLYFNGKRLERGALDQLQIGMERFADITLTEVAEVSAGRMVLTPMQNALHARRKTGHALAQMTLQLSGAGSAAEGDATLILNERQDYTVLETVLRDHVALALLFFIALSGFLTEGFRLRAAPPPWPEPAPVAVWIAGASGLSLPAALAAHRLWWWIHAAASLALVAYLPFSKFLHVFAATANGGARWSGCATKWSARVASSKASDASG